MILVMVQRAPRSIRLTEVEEIKTDKLAKRAGLTWHGWLKGLISGAILKEERRIKRVMERDDQERCI